MDERGDRFDPIDYYYHDEHGVEVLLVQRRWPKTFHVYHPDGFEPFFNRFTYAPGVGSHPPVLYRLPELLKAKRDELIYVCEGEKDAEALYQRGMIATTNVGGPGQWRPNDTAALAGRHVVILPDNDDEGDAHAEQVAAALSGTAGSVRVLRLPDLPESGDVSDWLAAGVEGFDDMEAALAMDRRLDELEELARLVEPELPPATGSIAIVTRLSDVVPRPVEWLWEGWLPRGKLSLVGGHAGEGKSTVTAAIAAILSVGGVWPDGSRAPRGASIFLLAEDALDDTLRPRLEQHGADLSVIESLDAVRQKDGRERAFSLGDHLDALERRVAETKALLVVIDPLSSFLSSRNRNDEGDIRDVLTPLGKLAERRNVAILGVMHVGKPGAVRRTLLQSLMGSTAFGAVARLALIVHPIPGSERRLLAVIKSNLARIPKPQEWSRPDDSAIVWHGESQHDLETLFHSVGETKLPREDAEAFLTRALANGPRLSREVFEEAGQVGISERTLRRAANAVGASYRKIGGVQNSPWYVALPDADWSGLERDAGKTRDLLPAPQLQDNLAKPV